MAEDSDTQAATAGKLGADASRPRRANASESQPSGYSKPEDEKNDGEHEDGEQDTEVVEGEGFTLARLLDVHEGPAILRHEWHEIIGAFQPEIAKIREDATAAEQRLSKDEAVERIEAWLKKREHVDNPVAA